MKGYHQREGRKKWEEACDKFTCLVNIHSRKDIELVFTRNEFQITGPNFLWPCANSRLLIQHKAEEAILISMVRESHLVVFSTVLHSIHVA